MDRTPVSPDHEWLAVYMTAASVTIFGANGRIGRMLIALICQNMPFLTLRLVVRDLSSLYGLSADAASVTGGLDIKLLHYDDLNEASDLNIVLAGGVPTAAQKEFYASVDPTGRFVQAAVNQSIVSPIGEIIKRIDSSTSTIVVSNQSDLLSGLLRFDLELEKVYGFGNMLDSYRFRAASGDASAYVVGYHSDDMMLMGQAIHSNGIETLLNRVKNAGVEISNAYKPSIKPFQQSGASFGPALCLFNALAAFFGQTPPIIEPFNHCPTYLDFIGPVGVGLPMEIGSREIKEHNIQNSLARSDIEELRVRHAQMHNAMGVMLRAKDQI